jgi:hypothetical protein
MPVFSPLTPNPLSIKKLFFLRNGKEDFFIASCGTGQYSYRTSHLTLALVGLKIPKNKIIYIQTNVIV